MPNHVINILTVSTPVMEALTRVVDSVRVVDFALIVPTPDDYLTEGCGHQHPFGHMFSNMIPGLPEEEDPYSNCWYPWNIRNWGTKWNAYDAVIEESEPGTWTVNFDTAWSHPDPIIQALSARFPDEIIYVRYADEDLGNNIGSYTIKGGVIDSANLIDGSDEALDFASELWYGMSYAELEQEHNDTQINHIRRVLLAEERGVPIQDIEIDAEFPQHILDAVPDMDAVRKYWEEADKK